MSEALGLLGAWGYLALLVLLILNGVGSPIPEDLVLLTTGYLVHAGVFQWPAALIVSAAGVATSDLMLYSAGRHIAWRSARWSDRRLLSDERLQRASRWFKRRGHVIILIARLVPGTRAIVFMAAGANGIPLSSFVRLDLLGTAIWVPAVLSLGYALGDSVGDIDAVMTWMQRSMTWTIAIAALLFLAWLSWGREVSKL